MLSIKKKSGKPENGINQDVLAMRIANRIIKLQAGIANYLNSTAHFSQNQKKVILISICVLFGGFCLYIILNSIN